MKIRTNILYISLMLLIIVPTVGINFNTHICGQTEDVSKSLVIPGILSPDECDKCHKVVVVKSCCSSKEDGIKKEPNRHENEKGCCKDILEYSSYDYLTITPFIQNLISISSTYNRSISNLDLEQTNTLLNAHILKTRLRPYVVDIIPLKCAYLI